VLIGGLQPKPPGFLQVGQGLHFGAPTPNEPPGSPPRPRTPRGPGEGRCTPLPAPPPRAPGTPSPGSVPGTTPSPSLYHGPKAFAPRLGAKDATCLAPTMRPTLANGGKTDTQPHARPGAPPPQAGTSLPSPSPLRLKGVRASASPTPTFTRPRPTPSLHAPQPSTPSRPQGFPRPRPSKNRIITISYRSPSQTSKLFSRCASSGGASSLASARGPNFPGNRPRAFSLEAASRERKNFAHLLVLGTPSPEGGTRRGGLLRLVTSKRCPSRPISATYTSHRRKCSSQYWGSVSAEVLEAQGVGGV
jgi:hypothetical protein